MRVDKGDHVEAGQVLGVLESPEVDQQVAAAEADLAVKRRTFERYQQLVKKDFVSAQDFETARAQYEVSLATLEQATRAAARTRRCARRSPATVTARYVDPGALVPAATGSTAERAAARRRSPICGGCASLVFVQQDAAPFVHAGDRGRDPRRRAAGPRITAPVNRCAGALDPRTRTMLCEIWLDNQNRLYPGTFVHVTFHLVAPRTPMIDSGALVLRNHKPSVAVVRDGRVHFVPVRPGLDDGKTVQIIEGLSAGARVVLAPPSELAENDVVQPVERQREAPPDGGAAKSGSDEGCAPRH